MAQINKPDEYFNTVLYTGNGSTQSITGVNFQPDFNWIKHRNGTSWHTLTDSVRGISKNLFSNETNAEVTNALRILSFDSDGLTVGNDVNNSGNTYVAWNWLADNTSGSSNTDGSITSTVSANTTSGFSIVSWTGNATSGATIGHGLGVEPSMIIIKNRSSVTDWAVYHKNVGNNKKLLLNTTDAESASSYFNSTSPTSTVFSVNNSDTSNGSGNSMIAYCFAEKKGFSKFGSYTGNGSTDGTFVYTGFKPAWFMVKKSSAAGDSWVIIDNTRFPYNYVDKFIYADEADAESGSAERLDILSNGIKLKDTTTSYLGTNISGGTYIYMAFAESPLVGTNNIPAVAR